MAQTWTQPLIKFPVAHVSCDGNPVSVVQYNTALYKKQYSKKNTVKFQFTLVAEQNLKSNEHPKFEDDIPQFSGKIDETVVEWVAGERLWEAQHKDVTKPVLDASSREHFLDS